MGMEKYSSFELYPKPSQSNIEALGQEPPTALVGAGIVNPFGPTFTAITVKGKLDRGKDKPIFRIMLNPFSQEISEIGVAKFQKTWRPLMDLEPFFKTQFGSCPTMLFPITRFKHEQSVRLYAKFFTFFEDARKVLEQVRKFPGDPWNRVEQEIKDSFEPLLDRKKYGEIQGLDTKRRKLTEEEAFELALTLLDFENLKQEFSAFMYAWKGSIEFVGDTPLAESAMSIDTFKKHLDFLSSSFVVPQADDRK